jgi:hypothetical protein
MVNEKHIQSHFDMLRLRSEREISQAIKNLPDEISKKSYGNTRIIKGNGMHLRHQPNTKSKSFGLLYIGKVVREIEKRNKWILVEVTLGDADKTVRGWVFSKYTLPIR